jgi:hypothetical protein
VGKARTDPVNAEAVLPKDDRLGGAAEFTEAVARAEARGLAK